MRVPPIVLLALAALVPAGCDLPRDSAGTLARLRGGELRVGVTDNRPWVRIEGEHVEGVEPALIRMWAERVGAQVRWVRGDLDGLVRALEAGQIDILAAGLTSSTPYRARLALSQTYYKSEERVPARGSPGGEAAARRRVIAAMPGESALLLALDRFLLGIGEARMRALASREAAR